MKRGDIEKAIIDDEQVELEAKCFVYESVIESAGVKLQIREKHKEAGFAIKKPVEKERHEI